MPHGQVNIASRDILKVIAQRAMIQRGLLPNFSFAVVAEADAIVTAAAETDPSIRDRRDFLWCSIDNDDSLDLDQLTAVEPRAGRQEICCLARKVLFYGSIS